MAAKRARTTGAPELSAGVAVHPRAIQPTGNSYFEEKYLPIHRKDLGLGAFSCLPDELVLEVSMNSLF